MLAAELRAHALQAREDVMYETVTSHPSKLAELQQAKTGGYRIDVFLVAVESPTINTERVAVRVAAGGHDVPEDRIRARYERTLALAPVAIGLADQAVVFDNTPRGAGLTPQAALRDGRLVYLTDAPAQWVQRLVERVNERAAEQQAFIATLQARGLPLRPVRLDGDSTQGPIIAVGKHQVLQYDESTRTSVLHDRVLLGAQADALATREGRRVAFREGVASVEPSSPERSR